MIDQDKPCIVVDNGSSSIKAGVAGNPSPSTDFTSVIGRPKIPGIIVGMDQREFYIGQEAMNRRGVLNITNPIKNGLIINWEDMEKLWHHCFYSEMKVSPEEHPCLFTESPLNPKQNREKITEIVFETFNVPSFYLQIQSTLSLFSQGKTTGIVLDSGASVTYSVPVYEGYAVPHAIQKMSLSGEKLTDYLSILLQKQELFFTTQSEKEIIDVMKTKVCYVSQNYAKDSSQKVNQIEYELPDGRIITLGQEQFMCPEMFFQPELNGLTDPSFHQILVDSVQNCDPKIRRDLYQNIILSGGATCFQGLKERLQDEIQKMLKNEQKIKVIAPPERKYSVWNGGSMLASLDQFQTMWITKQDYEERGPTIVHRKCY